ncbi:MAG: lipid A biosynthesis lauroyl acyltransferase [Gammaproteobacteria bacterium]|nr:lipid A biosynthesis lauroyl acyltransferase [Gammaproteobacteria bacterium]
MSSGDDLSLKRFRAPRYWPTWLLWLSLRLVAKLPFRLQLALGRGLGRLLGLAMRRQRRIARRNLGICFPELSQAETESLLARHFEAVGMSFVEMGIGWFTPVERLRRLIRVEGREHLERAMADERGVLLLTAHFTTLETGVSIFLDVCPGLYSMYRPQRNAMTDVMIRKGRSRFTSRQIARDNVRALVRALKAGKVVAYLPDQTYVGNQSTLLPFFGEPAMTNVAMSKLARIGNARVLPYLFRRLPGTEGYLVTIGPPFEGVPSDDAAADTLQWVHALERHIRLAPDQYLWLYKKFKNRPPPLPDPYADL